MSKLRDSSINVGAMPGSLPNVPHMRPAPPKYDTPKDSGGMSSGSTSGNFKPSSMTSLPNNAGPTGTKPVADLVAEEFQAPGTGIL